MNLSHLVKFAGLIESVGIEYMITGSIASILYGKPRLTQDMDVVIVIPLSKIKDFVGLFDISEYYCPPHESIKEEISFGEKGHLNIIDQETGFKIDLYPAGADELNHWGLSKKKRVELIPREEAWIAPPEYVVLKKLVYYKEGGSQKHVDDIKGMLEVSGDDIDRSIIACWAKKVGVVKEWNNASMF